MKIASVLTKEPNLRSEIIGYTYEDSDLVVAGKAIGLTPAPYPKLPDYDCVLRMIAHGWKLLSGPTTIEANEGSFYDWWLTK